MSQTFPNFRNRSVNVHDFAMIPRADIPRSSFRMQKNYKTTLDAGYLVPFYVDEILPGDAFNCRVTSFIRMSTLIFPLMDNLYFDTFFFFVPARLVWDNWPRFMGERDPDPDSSISYTIPQVSSPVDGWENNTVADYFGLPTVGQYGEGHTLETNALPFRAYNLIYNEWFRDQNLQDSATVRRTDSGDVAADYPLRKRGKRHDYFTSCLPFLQKGTSVPLPLGVSAPVKTSGTATVTGVQSELSYRVSTTGAVAATGALGVGAAGGRASLWTGAVTESNLVYPSNLYADLSAATAATINQIRQSFQIQKLLERDARGGTRYTELVRSHFGVLSPDARLQRPEYLGGGSTPFIVNAVAQTSVGSAFSNTPTANLTGVGQAVADHHGFSQSFTEHGYVIGLCNIRADLTYYQGVRRFWSRQTRYDFYFPVFAALGEQAVLNQEIYATGDAEDDVAVFGYQERWAEYRYNPSQITGYMRPNISDTLDSWHLAQAFAALPLLNDEFIQEDPPIARVIAAGSAATGYQFIMDAFFDVKAARPMPMYSVPGLVDHF